MELVIITVALLIIIGVLLFELIIFSHEFGHFITAKKSGVKVNEFALGMGPKIFSFTKGETQYSLRIFPIGGYCAMEGEDEENNDPRAFNNVKVWKRMIIVIAGAVMNIILGFVLMFVIVVQMPSYSSTTVSSFPQMSYSASCGLEEGDKITNVNGYSLISSRDLSYAIASSKLIEADGKSLNIYREDCCVNLAKEYSEVLNSKTFNKDNSDALLKNLDKAVETIRKTTTKEEAKAIYEEYSKKLFEYDTDTEYSIMEIEEKDTRQRYRADMTVVRNGEKLKLTDIDFYTYSTEDNDTPQVSVDFYVEPIEKNALTVITQTGAQTVSVVKMIWSTLVGLVTGQYGFKDISGPIGAASAVTQVASSGLENSFLDAVNNIIFMMMIISVNLGVFNMLPFPALDGGRFVFLLIEGIRKKPIPRKYEAIVNGVGMAILFAFMIVISFKDVFQLIGG